MYRRAVLAVCGGRTVLAGPVSSCRYTEHSLRCVSVRRAYCSDKSPSEDNSNAKPPTEKKKEGDAPRQEEPSQPLHGERLISLLSGMKVEVSSNKKFQAVKKKKMAKQKLERIEGLESASKMFQMASEESRPDEEKTVSPELAAAASAVASTFPDKKNQVESELLQQLRLHKQMAEAQRKGDLNIKDVISGMTVRRQPQKKTFAEDGPDKRMMRELNKSSLGLFTNKRLKIFPVSSIPEQTPVTVSSPNLWDIELARGLATASEQPPRNGFEEMIQWTNEGKLWTFPINNEAGLDEEQNVEFHEHIFLEKYLKDFPNQGPIRHFMELVVCGLSKNPYLTVQQKKEHIDWFRDYFHKKDNILRESEVYLG